MKLDKIILILYFTKFPREVFVFSSQSEYKKFIEANLEDYELMGLESWEFYFAKLAQKG